MKHSSIYEVAHWRTHAPVSILKGVAKDARTFACPDDDLIHAWLPTRRAVTFTARYVMQVEAGQQTETVIHPGERVRVILQGDAITPSFIRVTST